MQDQYRRTRSKLFSGVACATLFAVRQFKPGQKLVKIPRNLKPNEIVPFTPAEVTAILKACDGIGKNQYERLRCRAMILMLRYSALRIGDVSMLARDRISRDGERWRIFLRTEKSGQPCFPTRSARYEGGTGCRTSSATESGLPVFLLERARQAEKTQGGCGSVSSCGVQGIGSGEGNRAPFQTHHGH